MALIRGWEACLHIWLAGCRSPHLLDLWVLSSLVAEILLDIVGRLTMVDGEAAILVTLVVSITVVVIITALLAIVIVSSVTSMTVKIVMLVVTPGSGVVVAVVASRRYS